jgi:hypothetical protein
MKQRGRQGICGDIDLDSVIRLVSTNQLGADADICFLLGLCLFYHGVPLSWKDYLGPFPSPRKHMPLAKRLIYSRI